MSYTPFYESDYTTLATHNQYGITYGLNIPTQWMNRPLSNETYINPRTSRILPRQEIHPLIFKEEPFNPRSAVYCTSCDIILPQDLDYRRTGRIVEQP